MILKVASRVLFACLLILAVESISGCSGSGGGQSTQTPSNAFYVDCSQSSNGSGTEASPWNSLSSPNSATFAAGSTIYFKRGATCSGIFEPQGSGSANEPIAVDAYGSGALPIIAGGTTDFADLSLQNQSYWTIKNIAFQGGKYWAISVKATNNTAVSGITISNVTATGANYVSTSRTDSGEIEVAADGSDSSTVSDVSISGVTAENTKASEGIFVSAGNNQSMTGVKGSNISVTNSTVSNVYGDGILVIDANNVTISGNTVTKSGECPSCGASTPGAIWVWNTTNSVLSSNESYANNSWGGDGGGLDIDYWNSNVTVEKNYIHDNKGYCVSVFGSENQATVNSIIRFNVCINNDAWSTSSAQGDFFLNTWNGGSLNGVEIYNNTSYWTSSLANNYALMANNATFSGSNPSFFKNNLVYSTLQYPDIAEAISPMALSNNLYYSSDSAPQYWFGYNGSWWDSFSTYQSSSTQDANSILADPLLASPGYDVNNVWPTTQYTPQSGSPAIGVGTNVCAGISGCSMGSSDFLGNSLPSSNYWIGAIQ